MCGIAGIATFDGRPVDPDVLQRMNDSLIQRGPEGSGVFHEPGIGLTHRRLRIIDLTAAGAQPMATPEGDVVVTFNGEIYNHPELRTELLVAGCEFRSRTDTEVLLHGYRRWGLEGLIDRLNGMFAFALYDRRARRLYLGRDRFGEKPLYYVLKPGGLTFASEIRAIRLVEPDLTLDHRALDYYLSELSVPQPLSIWREARQVEASAYLDADLATGSVRQCVYGTARAWADAVPDTPAQADAAVEEELRAAVRRRLVADVPVGAFLSGGVDSGLIVALAAGLSPEPLRTFTVGFRPETLSELPEARSVAARYQTHHTEIVVEPSVVDILPSLLEYFGEPFGDASAVPTYYVCRAIAGQVKVALSGDGGDEMFGGYHEYATAAQADEYAVSAPRWRPHRRARELGNRFLYRLGAPCPNYGHLEAFLRQPPALMLHREMGFSPLGPKPYGTAFDDDARGWAARHLERAWETARCPAIFDTLANASLGTRLLNDYLVKVDRASMLNSLEVRSPFLDHRLSALALALPARLKVPGGRPKLILRRLAARLVTDRSIVAPKRGFGIPVTAWLRGPLQAFLWEQLSDGALRKSRLLDWQAVQALLTEHMSGTCDHGDRLWGLLCLEIWMTRCAK